MKQQSSSAITSLGEAPDAERKTRMVKYAAAMGVRVVCIMACFVTPGWWLLIPAAGAVLLPYFAVLVANQVTVNRGDNVERPGGLLPYRPGGESA